jgi:hypothetical protein
MDEYISDDSSSSEDEQIPEDGADVTEIKVQSNTTGKRKRLKSDEVGYLSDNRKRDTYYANPERTSQGKPEKAG